MQRAILKQQPEPVQPPLPGIGLAHSRIRFIAGTNQPFYAQAHIRSQSIWRQLPVIKPRFDIFFALAITFIYDSALAVYTYMTYNSDLPV